MGVSGERSFKSTGERGGGVVNTGAGIFGIETLPAIAFVFCEGNTSPFSRERGVREGGSEIFTGDKSAMFGLGMPIRVTGEVTGRAVTDEGAEDNFSTKEEIRESRRVCFLGFFFGFAVGLSIVMGRPWIFSARTTGETSEMDWLANG